MRDKIKDLLRALRTGAENFHLALEARLVLDEHEMRTGRKRTLREVVTDLRDDAAIVRQAYEDSERRCRALELDVRAFRSEADGSANQARAVERSLGAETAWANHWHELAMALGAERGRLRKVITLLSERWTFSMNYGGWRDPQGELHGPLGAAWARRAHLLAVTGQASAMRGRHTFTKGQE